MPSVASPEFVTDRPSPAETAETAETETAQTAGAAPGPDRGRLRTGAIAGAVTLGSSAAVLLTNPTDTGVPICWSQGVFGVDCPLCGGLRCANSLLRGDVVAAADHNVLLAIALPIVAVGWVVWMVRAWQGRPMRLPSLPVPVIALLAVVVVAFSVVRNIDATGFVGWLGSTRT